MYFFSVAVIGQLVGNGFTIKFEPEPAESVKVCLAVRFDIPQDKASYYIKDFANAREDGTVGWPQEMEVTAVEDNAPYCAMINKSGTYFPIIRRDFTAGDYTLPFLAFTFVMLSCCASSIMAVKKTKPAYQAKTRSLAAWTCASCFISFVMVVVLIPAFVPGQCPLVSGWGYVYGFGFLCIMGCFISTCCTIGWCIKGNSTERVQPIEEQKGAEMNISLDPSAAPASGSADAAEGDDGDSVVPPLNNVAVKPEPAAASADEEAPPAFEK